MLGLTLRDEFKGRRPKGTVIELTNEAKTGATQQSAADFLSITYPTADVLAALEAIGPGRGQPVVLIGERGQGKSHLLAVLYHALSNPEETRRWLGQWATQLGQSKLAELTLRPKTLVISDSLHKHNHKFLWDLLFREHPHGDYARGMWNAEGEKNRTPVPSEKILLEMFRKQPTALILDEFQTWFDGLTETKQQPLRSWAFNLIQVLSEIATEHPELLVLVVSVRDGNSDAYQQIHRVNPRRIDFKGPNARRDRLRLLLHRLFQNRLQVPVRQIEQTIAPHVAAYLRLADVPPADHDRVRRDFVGAWPFTPQLMTLLEDQVLVATQAQETRDLIRILADLYKSRGEESPVLTAADFRLDDDKSGIVALLDSVSNEQFANLRAKAQRNIEAVRDAVRAPGQPIEHLVEVVSALWLRSLAIKNAGAEPRELQVDITRAKTIDDNAFLAELETIRENSFNIHEDGPRLVFREEENPQSKLIANARNDRQFEDGSDKKRLALEVRYVIGGAESATRAYRVVVLGGNWETDPFSGVEESELPARWDDRIPLLVLPAPPRDRDAELGTWLKERLQSRRNAVRFLLPREASPNLFYDRNLLVLARCVVLAERWKAQNPEFKTLQTKYERQLRDILKQRFDRFAILASWNYQDPRQCRFHVEGHRAEGEKIPDVISELVQKNLFVPENFEEFVLAAAGQNESVGKLLKELQEPRAGGADCIPWLGETLMKEKLERICARGAIAINVRGTDLLQLRAGEDQETAWKRIRGSIGTGRHLDDTFIRLTQAEPTADGIAAPRPSPLPLPPLAPPLGSPSPLALVPSGEQLLIDRGAGDFGGGTPPTSGGPSSDLFGGAAGVRSMRTPAATSALNLLATVERWGINPGSRVQNVKLSVPALTGAQLQDLLRKLPDGVTYELFLDKEEK
jgi:hypothetical protein